MSTALPSSFDLYNVQIKDSFSLRTLRMHKEDLGAIDIETTITPDPWVEVPELISVALTFDGRRAFVFTDMELLASAKRFLEGCNWIMHNGLFDRLIMRRHGYDLTLKHDTQAMQYLLDPDGQGRRIAQKPNSLENVSKYWLELEPYKNVNYEKIKEEPIESVALMNCEDARRTFNLYRPLADQLNKDKQLSRIYQWVLMPTVNALITVTEHGINIDKETLDEVTSTYQSKVEEEHKEIVAGAPPHPDGWPKPSWWRVREHGKYQGEIFNPASPQQVGYVLFDHYKLPVIEETDTGAPSTKEDVLLQLEVDDDTPREVQEWLGTLRRHRKDNKILTAYLQSWPQFIDKNEQMHPRFKPLHVVTGRLSSEKPNIQQVPRDSRFRSLFTSPPGMTWIKADYSQIELRIAAWLANEPTLLAAYEAGVDVHQLTASTVLGDPEFRQGGKTLNFGLLYGAGPKTLQRVARSDYDVWFSLEEARRHRTEFFRAYPKLETWQKINQNRIIQTGMSRSPLGRVRYLPHAKVPWEVEDMVGKKIHSILEGINHQVQSLAGDLTNMAVVRLVEAGYNVVAAVHDEIDLVVPDDEVEHTIGTVRSIMEDVSWLQRFGIKLTVPVVVDVETGKNWGMT